MNQKQKQLEEVVVTASPKIDQEKVIKQEKLK